MKSKNEWSPKDNARIARTEGFSCDGYCYGHTEYDENGEEIYIPMCNGVDICPVTRKSEGVATLLLIIIIFSVLVALLGLGIAALWFVLRIIFNILNGGIV